LVLPTQAKHLAPGDRHPTVVSRLLAPMSGGVGGMSRI